MKTLYKWSVENYHRIVATGILNNEPVELLDGEILRMSPEGPLHRFTNHEIVKYLRNLLDELAEVFEAHPVTLDNSEPEPDVAIIRLPNSNYLSKHPYPSDIYWLIEIANSTLDEDLGRKKAIYARNHISEYWVIDLQNSKVCLFTQPQNDDYLQKQEVTTGIINPLAFPQIGVEVERLLNK